MKILEVVDFFKPSWEAGGIVRVCYEISKCLTEHGHDVTVYATDGFKTRVNSPKNVPVNVDDIRTYYFKNASHLLARRNIYTPYYLFFVARKDILNYDIIHIHTYRSPMAVCIAWYARRNGIQMKSESSEATRERAVNVLQLNSALHLVFAYGRTVNVGHLLHVRETFENLPNNGEATT